MTLVRELRDPAVALALTLLVLTYLLGGWRIGTALVIASAALFFLFLGVSIERPERAWAIAVIGASLFAVVAIHVP